MSSETPESWLSAVSVWNRPTGRPSAVPTSASRAPSSTAGIPSSRPATLDKPVRERGELAREQPEDPVAQEVDPGERVPAILLEIHLLETVGVELHEQQVAIDGFVERQGRRIDGGERRRPALGERQPCRRRPPAETSGHRSSWR